MAAMAFIRRHPLATYYSLAFAISWGGMLLAVGGPDSLPGSPQQLGRLPLAALALMPGPSLAGVLVTGLVSGREGLRDLWNRLLRWRVAGRWYAVALLTAPLLTAAVVLGLSLFSPDFLPAIVKTDRKVSLLLLGTFAGLWGGLLEELGWTGFAVPRLTRRHGVLATGLIAGVLWGVWHLLVNFWSSGFLSGGLSLTVFFPVYFALGVAQLTAYRVLMVWVYDQTESLLVALLMHASLIVSTIAVLAPQTTGAAFLTWFFVLTAVLWLIVAAALRRQFSRHRLRRQWA